LPNFIILFQIDYNTSEIFQKHDPVSPERHRFNQNENKFDFNGAHNTFSQFAYRHANAKVEDGKRVLFCGLGSTSQNRSFRCTESSSKLSVHCCDEKCSNMWKNRLKHEEMICAGGFAEGGKGFCFTDSGGPFSANSATIDGSTRSVSWTQACAQPGCLNVYGDDQLRD